MSHVKSLYCSLAAFPESEVIGIVGFNVDRELAERNAAARATSAKRLTIDLLEPTRALHLRLLVWMEELKIPEAERRGVVKLLAKQMLTILGEIQGLKT